MVPISFPPGEILDREGIVWVSLPEGVGLDGTARILGTCDVVPSALVLRGVWIDVGGVGGRRIELVPREEPAPFPIEGHAFKIPDRVLPGVSSVRVTVHVERVSGAPKFMLTTFQLTLLTQAAPVRVLS